MECVSGTLVVKGVFKGSSSVQDGIFLYEYTCPQCQRLFRESSPEVSVPSLCHRCYTGLPDCRESDKERKWRQENPRKRNRKSFGCGEGGMQAFR